MERTFGSLGRERRLSMIFNRVFRQSLVVASKLDRSTLSQACSGSITLLFVSAIVTSFEVSIGSGKDAIVAGVGRIVHVDAAVATTTGLIFNDDAADDIAFFTGLIFCGALSVLLDPPAVEPSSNVNTTPALPSSPSIICFSVVDSHCDCGTSFRRHTKVAVDSAASNSDGGSAESNRSTRSNSVDDPRMGGSGSLLLSAVVVGTVRRAPDHAHRTTTLMGELFFLPALELGLRPCIILLLLSLVDVDGNVIIRREESRGKGKGKGDEIGRDAL
mmetsp:Transcript_372/g.855  ORF Transcript_372/g.855 Transcript_372/m.855 type:complete len:274 (+) Transcript_372:1303-2124(+)